MGSGDEAVPLFAAAATLPLLPHVSFRWSFPRWRIRLKNCRLQYDISCSPCKSSIAALIFSSIVVVSSLLSHHYHRHHHHRRHPPDQSICPTAPPRRVGHTPLPRTRGARGPAERRCRRPALRAPPREEFPQYVLGRIVEYQFQLDAVRPRRRRR